MLSVIDATNGNVLQTAPLPGISSDESQLAITPDGQFLYFTDNFLSLVDQINTTTLAINPVSTGAFLPFVSPIGVTIDLTGTFAYVADASANVVDVIQISSNTVVDQLSSPFFNSPTGIAITPDGSAVYVANNYTGSNVAVINTSNFSITSVPTNQTNNFVVAMAPLCSSGFSGSLKGRIGKNRDIWQTELFSQLCWTSSGAATPSSFLIYRNGKLIATVSGSHTSFEDHNLKPDKTYVYSVYASTSGTQSFVGTVTLKTN